MPHITHGTLAGVCKLRISLWKNSKLSFIAISDIPIGSEIISFIAIQFMMNRRNKIGTHNIEWQDEKVCLEWVKWWELSPIFFQIVFFEELYESH